MSMRNHIIVLLFSVFILVIMGCQGGNNPAEPDPSGISNPTITTPAGERTISFDGGGHTLLAYVTVSIDAVNHEIDVEWNRTTENHLNLKLMLGPPYCVPAESCLDFINLTINEETATCDLDVVVHHPIPDDFTDLYDMRGIGIFIGILDGFSDGSIGTQMLNADGYTTVYDAGGVFDAFLNPYVLFNTDLEDRRFENMSTTDEHITVQFPSLLPTDAKFDFALDASWNDPNLVDPLDPATSQHIMEPYSVEVIYADHVSDEYDSSGTVIVEVRDWQANAGEVEAECPDLLGGAYNMTLAWEDEQGYYQYYYELINDNPATPGEYPLLIKANDEFSTQPDLMNPGLILDLDNYQLAYMTVYDSAVDTAPVVSVVHTELSISPGQSVTFDASGSYDAEDTTVSVYAWDLDGDLVFDDADTAIVEHTYDANGTYPVNVIITDLGGLTDVLEMPLIVSVTPTANNPPVAQATASKYDPNIDEEITLDASTSYDLEDSKPVSWEWDLDGDGSYDDDSGEVITASWSEPGIKEIDVLVKDSEGFGDNLDDVLLIDVQDADNLPPIAAAVADKVNANVGEPVNFDGSGSSDPDGQVTQWLWDFDGDGLYTDGFAEIMDYTFWGPGIYNVDLKVVDNLGADDTLDTPLTIAVSGDPNEAPTAVATVDKHVVNVDEPITFDGTDSTDPEEGSPVVYEWDLDGDGLYIDQFMPTFDFFYTSPGEYDIDLRVCDTPGLCDTLDDTIHIQVLSGSNQAPVAVASADKNFIYLNDTVMFDGSQSYDYEDGAPVSWQWDLDEDGEYDDSPFIVASKQYTELGVFQVDLKVTDSEGAWDTLDDLITVEVLDPGSNAPPNAIGEVNCVFPFIDQPLIFTSDSFDLNGEVVMWEWDFGDGNGWIDFTATEGDTTFAYTEEGVFFADLRVTDDMSAQSTLDQPISILVSEPDFEIPTDPPSCAGTNETHILMVSSPMEKTNTNTTSSDIAFLQTGDALVVVNDKLYTMMPPSLLNEPALIEGVGGTRSIDTSANNFLALSNLDDGIVRLYTVQFGEQGLEAEMFKEIDAGQPISAICFDDMDNLWLYVGGMILRYTTPQYELNPCKVFDVSSIESMGTVDEIEYMPWNHSVYVLVNDGAGGVIVEVNYLGIIDDTLTGVLPGPSNHMDIVIDKQVLSSEASACRIEVFGGITEGYITRLDADLNVLASITTGYWGFRAAAIEMGTFNMILALEDCCLSWVDMLTPPHDWLDE